LVARTSKRNSEVPPGVRFEREAVVDEEEDEEEEDMDDGAKDDDLEAVESGLSSACFTDDSCLSLVLLLLPFVLALKGEARSGDDDDDDGTIGYSRFSLSRRYACHSSP
jgi:hypothetical protein